ncbi:MAG: phosphatase PAP2 family protein [Coriobacteriia bacterium]
MNRRQAGLLYADPRPGALVIAFGVAAAIFSALLTAVLLYRPFVAFDRALSAAVRSMDIPAVDVTMRCVTDIGNFWVAASATAVLVAILLVLRRPAEAAFVVVGVGGGAALGDVLRGVIERARPGLEVARIPVPDTYSFPSGHALASFLFFGALFFVVALEARTFAARAWTLAACVAIAALVALSRVYLGVHWFGDVAASWIVGSGWLTLCAAAYFAFTSGETPQ